MVSQRDAAYAPPGYRRLAESFAGQEDVGLAGNLLHRLARYLGGDPSAPINVVSASSAAPAGLPDNTPASSAVFHVVGNPINYTLDGTVPGATTLNQIPAGSIVTLTGQPSLRAFQFCSAVATAATISGYFYD